MPSHKKSDLSDELCPVCRKLYLTKPLVCTGFYNPQNTGRMYQECDGNTHDGNDTCKNFFWRDDLKAEGPRKAESCIGPVCARGQKQGKVNQQCVHHFCIDCCRDAATRTAEICRAPRHRLRETASQPLTGQTTPLTPTRSAGPFGKQLSPYYAQKLQSHDFNIGTPSSAGPSREDIYQREASTGIKVKWWLADDEEPIYFDVSVPDYPWFHPKDCEAIISIVGERSCKVYGVFNRETQKWTITSKAQKVTRGSTLYLRTCAVTRTPGTPSASPIAASSSSPGKRRASSLEINAGDQGAKPAKRIESSQNSDTETIDLTNDEPSEARPLSELERPSIGFDEQPPSGRTTWPFLYTCDMAKGFRAFDAAKRADNSTADAFKTAFGCEFKASTFSNHLHVWRHASASALKEAEAAGREPGGEWNKLAKRYKK